MPADGALLLVTPVYNEAANVERVVRSVAAQTRPPERWIVVDDGSTDGTLELLRRLRDELGGFEILERAPAEDEGGADRLAVALEARAFNRALRAAGGPDAYAYVGKLDGDIELPPEWFATLLGRMDADATLGLTGGTLVERHGETLHRLRIPEHHIHGAVKLYSRACFEACGGIQERLAWDTIDETYARMRGFRTVTAFDLTANHLRPAASADGQLRGRARHGLCAWILHYPLPWIAARSVRMATMPPRGLSGAWFVGGYVKGAIDRVPRVEDPEFRRFTRRELRARVGTAVRRRLAGRR